MPSSDYAAAAGGALKLKGGGIDKKKKKKKPKPNPAESTADASTAPDSPSQLNSKSPPHTSRRSVSPSVIARTIKENGGRPKTEAERRHEEMRRKRLEEKVKKEGVKTHKEKVEELNKYLSGLSEHHDMPKIGPG
jgi:protein FAM32A